MAPEKSSPFDIAAIAASGDSDLARGTPCWSTTASRTVRSLVARIRSATSRALAAASWDISPCLATNPVCPTPESGSVLIAAEYARASGSGRRARPRVIVSIYPERARGSGQQLDQGGDADADDHQAQGPRGEAAADPGAELAAEDRAGRDQRGDAPVDVRERDEDNRGDAVDQAGQHVLCRVDPLQAVVERDAEQADEQHALGRAEVTAVDAGAEDEEPKHGPPRRLSAAGNNGRRPHADRRSPGASRQ